MPCTYEGGGSPASFNPAGIIRQQNSSTLAPSYGLNSAALQIVLPLQLHLVRCAAECAAFAAASCSVLCCTAVLSLQASAEKLASPLLFLGPNVYDFNLVCLQDFADSSVQVLALAKFSAMLAFTSGLQLLSGRPAYSSTQRTSMLMSVLGLLDVVGYATYCLGLELCGAALCTLINAAAQQLFTATLSRVLLGKRFTRLQQASVRGPACHCTVVLLDAALLTGRERGR